MSTHFLTWLGRLPNCRQPGKVCRSLLLPLLLLFAQHGELLHELSHYAAPETQQDSGKQHPHAGHCALCLAFAQIDSAAAPDAVAVQLLADLSFVQAPAIPVSARATELLAQRNRGPPTFL